MEDLISRQAAITMPVLPKEHRKYQTMNLDDAYELGWLDCQECIEKLPSAEPERKTGKWINKEVLNGCMFQSAKCSACGCYHTTPYMFNHFTKYNYCPSCGARMDEEEMQDATL